MVKILFLHGFYASGSCPLAQTLQSALAGQAEVLAPDLPLHPLPALEKVLQWCQKESPALLVGNSCGSFYAQIASKLTYIPALLGNPHFEMHQFLEERLGAQRYKSPRADGQQDFTITPDLVHEFEALEQCQFDHISAEQRLRVWGLFGENDSLAHYRPLFEQHYAKVYTFPGNHTPTVEEVRNWYAPLVLKLLHNTIK